MKQSSIVTFRVDATLKKTFQEICKLQDMTLAQALRKHMRQARWEYQEHVNELINAQQADHDNDQGFDEHGRRLM